MKLLYLVMGAFVFSTCTLSAIASNKPDDSSSNSFEDDWHSPIIVSHFSADKECKGNGKGQLSFSFDEDLARSPSPKFETECDPFKKREAGNSIALDFLKESITRNAK